MATKQKRSFAYQVAHTVAFAIVAFVVIMAGIAVLGDIQTIANK